MSYPLTVRVCGVFAPIRVGEEDGLWYLTTMQGVLCYVRRRQFREVPDGVTRIIIADYYQAIIKSANV